MSAKCNISEQNLSNPADPPVCNISFIDSSFVDKAVRSDIQCDKYALLDDVDQSENCKLTLSLKVYKDENLDDMYMLIGTGVGSLTYVSAYVVQDDSYLQLFFDYNEWIREEAFSNTPMSATLYFTDESKEDFRVISSYHDPSMGIIRWLHSSWEHTNGRLLLEDRVVQMHAEK